MVFTNQIISYKISGFTFSGNDTQLNYTAGVIGGIAQPSKALVLNSTSGITSGISLLTTTSLNTTNLTVNGTNVTTGILSNLSVLDGATEGTAVASKVLIVNSSRNINNINILTSTTLNGTIGTPSQTNITSLGLLTNLNSNGNVNIIQHNGTTTGLQLNSVLVTSTASELNKLSGVTTTTSELNKLSGMSSSTSELNKLTGVTTTTNEFNILSGVTASTAQLNFLSGITSGTVTANKAMVVDASRNITNLGTLTSTGNITSGGRLLIANSILGLSHKYTTGGTSEIITSSDGIDLNYIGTSTDNDFSLSINSTRYLNIKKTTGRVGINTLTPNQQLEINNISGNCLRLNNSGGSSYLDITINNTGTANMTLSGSSPNFSFSHAVNILSNTASTSTTTGALIITGGLGIVGSINSAGNLTTTGTIMINKPTLIPESLFDIIGSGSYVTGSYNKIFKCRGTNATPVTFEIQVNQNTAATSTNATWLGNITNNDLRLGTNDSTKMIILANGNVGINKLIPTYMLDVTGDINTTGALRTSVAGIGFIHTDGIISLRSYVNNGAAPGAAYFGTETNHNLSLQTNSTGRVFISNTGNVGIGNTNNTYKLDITGSLNCTSFYISGSQVNSTVGELNLLSGVTATTTQLNFLSGVTAGTVSNSKAIVTSSGGHISNMGNINSIGAFRTTIEGTGFRHDFSTTVDIRSMISGTDAIFGTNSSSPFHLCTGGPSNKRLSILSNGNIGINNISPTVALDITGAIQTSGNIKTSGGRIWMTNTNFGLSHTYTTGGTSEIITYSDGIDDNSIGTYTNNSFHLMTNNINRLSITPSGDINITNTTTSSGPTTGCFTASGGVGIADDLYVGTSTILGNTSLSNLASWETTGIQLTTAASTYTLTGTSTPTNLVANSFTAPTFAKAALPSINLGYSATVYIHDGPTLGSNLTVSSSNKYALYIASGRVKFNGATASTSISEGVLQLSGGIGINNNTDAVSSTNGGSLTTSGGIGIGKKLFVGTDLAVGGNSTLTGTLTINASGNGLLHSNGGVSLISNVVGANSIGLFGTSTAHNFGLITNGTVRATINGTTGAITGISALTATNLTGTLQTAAQANITSVGTLTSLSTGNITLNGTLITATAAELNYLDIATTGSAEASKALILDASKTIKDITKLQIGTNTTLGGRDFMILNNAANSGFRLGSSEATGNCLTFQWTYVGNNNSNNKLSIDIFGESNQFTLFKSGNIGIGNVNNTYKLDVSGAINTNSYLRTENSGFGFVHSNGAVGVVSNVVGTNFIGLFGTNTAHAFGLITNDINRLNISAAGNVNITNTTSSSSPTTGCFTASGGVGIADDLYVGTSTILGNTSLSNLASWETTGIQLTTAASTYTLSGTSTPTNLVANSFAAPTFAKAALPSSSLGYTATVYIQGCPTLGSNLTANWNYSLYINSDRVKFNGSIASTSIFEGVLQLSGGIGINHNTDAISSTYGGSLTTSGGVGIGKKLFVGTDLAVGGNSTFTGSLTLYNQIMQYSVNIKGQYNGNWTGSGFWGIGVNSSNSLRIGKCSDMNGTWNGYADVSMGRPTIISSGYGISHKPTDVSTAELITYNDGTTMGIGSYSSHEFQIYSNNIWRIRCDTSGGVYRSTNSSTFSTTSDIRLKENIVDADLNLCYTNIKNLRLVYYKWKDIVYENENDAYDKHRLGWIAQEVEQVLPSCVNVSENYGISDCKNINVDQIYTVLYGCTKKLIADKEILENKVINLENKAINLENKVINLENKAINLENKVINLEQDNQQLKEDIANILIRLNQLENY